MHTDHPTPNRTTTRNGRQGTHARTGQGTGGRERTQGWQVPERAGGLDLVGDDEAAAEWPTSEAYGWGIG